MGVLFGMSSCLLLHAWLVCGVRDCTGCGLAVTVVVTVTLGRGREAGRREGQQMHELDVEITASF